MSREIKWRKIPDDYAWQFTNQREQIWFGLSNIRLTITAGYKATGIAQNAKLAVEVKIDKSRKYKTILTREFGSSWEAKKAIDAVLFLLRHSEKENRYDKFISLISGIENAQKPEISTHTIRYPWYY